MDLNLSDTERLILSNQYEILAGLNPAESDDYLQLAQQLREGHESLYRKAFQNLSPVLSTEESEFVHNIVQLYSTLKYSYALLADKAGLDAGSMNFLGFDGNDPRESNVRRFALALKNERLYEDTLGASFDLNSHMQSVPGYRRMIAEWRSLGEPGGQFTREQIEKIVAAKYAA